ncbi:UvrD-helicase domain-containing protein [Marinobacter sp. ANT_B65]|uniref:UvrD-helicase domain-containing protein n=1 Tax=Marinobacter sp. ANT_B65 TaxID=2039467 RepID=UPI000BBE5B4E|nr:UvrD-helicase domain-containing protein [Marinobacter sp. ANT_B65]PCM45951.1 hypothetical protein CPA50_08325 [Marinobacter sp. ANT_B65]
MSHSAILPPQKLTLIKAGAGAGKTYTIQNTLAEWVKQGRVKADRILAVTFTTDAASEMSTRIRLALLKEGLMNDARLLRKSTISTIHAFGFEILKTFAYEAGNSPTPRQLTEQEQDFLLREALDKAKSIQPLLEDLQHFGYTGGYAGDEYQEGVDQLTSTILSVIGKLRSLGKGFATSPGERQALLSQAKAVVTKVYGHVQSDGVALTDDLWRAIEAVKAEYPDQTELEQKGEWGNNEQTREFVVDIYAATQEQLKRDWKLWANLQYTDKLKKIHEKHPRADLADAIWNAAEKLSVHPGPLNDALQHMECLIEGALEVLTEYQQTKEQAGLVDYSDMVHLANDMLASNPTWLDEIASGYDCLIIDEFQDTNPLQFALLRRFQNSSKHTFIVGDLKQSIMGFQGSDSRLFATLLDDSEQQPDVVKELDSNWRSTSELMDFINDMGETLYAAKYKKLTPKAGYQSDLPAVHALRFNKDSWSRDASSRSSKLGFTSEGNTALANHIADLLCSGKEITDRHTKTKRAIRGADIAVLARGHNRLRKFAGALRRAGIEVQIQQPGFLDCVAVRWVLNALQGLNNSRDQYAWLDLLTSPLIKGQNTDRLQALLTGYRGKFRFENELTEQLTPLRKFLRTQPFKKQLLTIIEEAQLFESLSSKPQGPQYRANLIKLIGLAEEFEALQPETLNAMGIAGKNVATFQVWLNQSKDGIDDQPGADRQAENAVVLKTWHSSKGLEWPVVMVLDAEKAFEPRFPNISMAYPSGGIDTMLEQSFVQILPQFNNKETKERCLELLAEDETETAKNLYYVALTRAREQIILPCWEGYADGSMLTYIEPLLGARAEQGDSTLYEERTVISSDADLHEGAGKTVERTGLRIAQKEQPAKLLHTISPSLSKDEEEPQLPETQTTAYSPGLNLDAFSGVPANELGTWVHRLYQVYLTEPGLISKAMAMHPCHLADEGQKDALILHFEAFKTHMNQLMDGVVQWRNEVPALGVNQQGQVCSGVIDLIVDGENESWLVDHKTDRSSKNTSYWHQLRYYSVVSGIERMAINWAAQNEFEISHL